MGRRKIREAFDRQAEAIRRCRAFTDTEKIWRILDYAGFQRGVRTRYSVLDVGCGPGHILGELDGHAYRAVGLDISPEMLRIAGERAPNAELYEGVAEELPFETGSFDIVLSRAAIHHVSDPQAAFNEMARVCRAGGYVVVAETMTSAEPEKARLHNYIEKLRDPAHNRMLTKEEYRAIIAAAGLQLVGEFETVDVREVGEWLDVTSPPPEAGAEVRRSLRESLEQDKTGLRPYMEGGSLHIRHTGTTFKAQKF